MKDYKSLYRPDQVSVLKITTLKGKKEPSFFINPTS